MITYNPKKLALVRGIALSLSESQLPSDLNDLVYRVRDYCATAEEWKTNRSSTGLQGIAEVVRDLSEALGLEVK